LRAFAYRDTLIYYLAAPCPRICHALPVDADAAGVAVRVVRARPAALLDALTAVAAATRGTV